MQKVLIAHSSEDLLASLETLLSDKFQVTVCSDGDTALELLKSLRPEILVLDLMLPYRDGITILEDAKPYIPSVILAITRHISHYVEQSAMDAGVGFILREPCQARVIVTRLTDMIRRAQMPLRDMQRLQAETAGLLLELGIPSRMDGFKQLQLGIPLYAQDPFQKLTKELYPAIAGLCGFGNSETVERSMRNAIKAAWTAADPRIWGTLFPPDADGLIPCPSNKEFISRLAEVLLAPKKEAAER